MSSDMEIELPNELLAFKKTLEATVKPYVEVKAKQDNDLQLWQSKFGGLPYLPRNYEYPRDSTGQYLSLLAQINFAETPYLERFPKSGILQFYISGTDNPNYLYGSCHDDLTKQDYFRVLYFANVVDEESRLETDFAFLPEDIFFPLEQPCSLTFSICYAPMPKDDYQFAPLIMEQNILDTKDNIHTVFEEYVNRYMSMGHKIGGYPCFMQDDPRRDEKYKNDKYILLFQMDTDIDAKIMWGDCGVGNFFIREQDLDKKNFSRILYYWDCC